MKYDVFISFKGSSRDGQITRDLITARKTYLALQSRGVKVFFSEESLKDSGSGHFSRSIESALESAQVLVLIASCREHIESKWVEAEWDSFLQDIRSGHKVGELFILNCGKLKPPDLPLFLRRQQMFRETETEKLLDFVEKALAPQQTLRDLIQLSLHCYRPDKNEDKVYIVTSQEGNSGVTRKITAHWGARLAKRLNSQVKEVNVSAETAITEIEKLLQEKIKGGYTPALLDNLLTPEAWTYLAASLGVPEGLPLMHNTPDAVNRRRRLSSSSLPKSSQKEMSGKARKKSSRSQIQEDKQGTGLTSASCRTPKSSKSPKSTSVSSKSKASAKLSGSRKSGKFKQQSAKPITAKKSSKATKVLKTRRR